MNARAAAAIATVAALTAAVLPARAAAPRPPACLTVALSPAFATDRTVFCAYEVPGDAAYLARSTDGGRTWRPGRAFHRDDDVEHFSPRLTVSPWYRSDHRVFAGTGEATYESTDGGATFRKVDTGDKGWGAFALTGFLDPQPVGPPRPAFAFVQPLSTVVSVYDPRQGTRGAAGTLAKDQPVAPIIPPDYASTRQAVVLAEPSIGLYDNGNETALDFGLGAYTCVADFVCRYRHFYFGNA